MKTQAQMLLEFAEKTKELTPEKLIEHIIWAYGQEFEAANNKIARLSAACRATLTFYSVTWTEFELKVWQDCTNILLGNKETPATTKMLCDMQRKALDL